MKQLSLGIVILLFTASFAKAAENCLQLYTGSAERRESDLVSALSCFQTQIVALEKQNENLQLVVPEHAAVFFDRTKGCPNGWTDLGAPPRDPSKPRVNEKFSGRVIVVAGEGGKDANGVSLKFGLREDGGEKAVTLTLDQTPTHDHPISVSDKADQNDFLGGSHNNFGVDPKFETTNRQEKDVIGRIGGGNPHQNMPPYVALYLCRKEFEN